MDANDVRIRYSRTTGPGDSGAGAAATSLGGFVSTTNVVSGALHNVFDVVSGAENAASDVEYRCVFICNTDSVDTLALTKVWILSQVASGASIAIGLDPAGVVGIDSASAQAATIATEQSAPTGVTFSAPTTEGAALSVGNLGPRQCRALWIRRTAADTAALANDGAELRVKGTVS